MKKLLSLLISISMVFSVGFAVSAEDEPSDGAVAAYDIEAYRDAGILMDNLVGERVFGNEPSENVSRARFVYGMTRIFSVPGDTAASQVYNDVSPEHEYFAAVSSAYNAGWISPGEKFNPDVAVTYGEAVKIILCAAGYEPMAAAKGGYPTGYLSVASSVNLSDNVNTVREGGIICADAMTMFYNLLMADTFEIESYGEKLEYRKGGETYLEKMYDAYEIEGVVTSTMYSSLVMDAPFVKDNDEITIDGVPYRCENIDEGLLGMRVKAYCTKDGIRKKLYCAIPYDNSELTFIADDYNGISGGYISYYANDRDKKARLDGTYKVVYNGRRVEKIEDYMLNDFGAQIRLVSNNGDSAYDVVFIDGYTYGSVTSVDYVDGYIGIKTPGEMLDLSDDYSSVYMIHGADGEDLEIFELSPGSVVALKISADSVIYDITLCEDTASGTVTEMNSDNDLISLDGVEYKVSNDFRTNYIDKSIVNLGDSISSAIGVHGELVYMISGTAVMNYGYLHDVANDEKGFDSFVRVKIYSTGGRFEVFDLAEKVTVDGNSSKRDRKDVYPDLVNAKSEIIRYGVNSDGEINVIDFASTSVSGFDMDVNPQDKLTLCYPQSKGQLRYRSGCKGFNSYALLSNATVLFVPDKEADKDDEKKYTVGTYSMLVSDTQYKCDIYDIDANGMAAFVVVYIDEDSDAAAKSYDSYIIERVSNALSNDEEGYNIYCWLNNKFYTLFMPNSVQVKKDSGNKLCSGDIVRFKLSGNEISAVYVDYYLADGAMKFNSSGGGINTSQTAEATLAFVSGKVYNMNKSSNMLSTTVNAEGKYDFSYENLKPYVTPSVIACYDTKTGKVRPLSADNIRTYRGYGDNADYVIIRENYTTARCMFVIR